MKKLNEGARIDRVRLLILDLDGTLADTIGSIRDAVNLAMNQYGYPERNYEEVRVAIGNGARELIRLTMPAEESKDSALVDRVFADYHGFYGETYLHCDTCYEGIPESLAALKERGYTLAVLSNKEDGYVKDLVKVLLPEGMISHAEGQTEKPIKPNPTVPLEIAASLGFAPEETAFLGDSEVDVMTGRNAGMLAVGCAWGYRNAACLEEAGADVRLEKPSEIADLFLSIG